MSRLGAQLACCAWLLLASISGVKCERLYKVAAIASPPFICSDMEPCKPSSPLSADFVKDPEDLMPGQCLNGGVRSMNGFCVHGLLIDLITYLRLNTSAVMPFELWYTQSSVVGGYNNLVSETANPGRLKSLGRLGACQNGKDNNENPCTVAPAGSSAGITWDYPCGDSPCDLAIGDITINWYRKRVLEAKFTLPYMDVGLKVITRAIQPSTISEFSNFLDPFTPGLWCCWIAFFFFSAFVFSVLEDPAVRGAWCCLDKVGGDDEIEAGKSALSTKLDADGDGNVGVSERVGYSMGVIQKYSWFSFLSPFFAMNPDMVETKLGRTYLFGWLLINFILTASYTASLTSFLVDDNIKVALPDLNFQEPLAWKGLPESLEKCFQVEGKECLATSLGGNTESMLKGFLRTNPEHFTSHIHDSTLSSADNYDRILREEVDGVVAWAADETTIDYAVLSQDEETQCKWVQVGEMFAVGAFGMVAGPSLPNDVFERVNQHLQWARDDRSLEGLKNVWYSSARQCFDERSETSALTIQDFGFLFIIVPAIALVGIAWRVSRQCCVVYDLDGEGCGGVFTHEPHPAKDFNDTHITLLRVAEVVKSMNTRVPGYNSEDDVFSPMLSTQEHWIADVDTSTNRVFMHNPSTKHFVWTGHVNPTPAEEQKLNESEKNLQVIKVGGHWISDTDLLTGRMYFFNPENKKHLWRQGHLAPEDKEQIGKNKMKPKSRRLSMRGWSTTKNNNELLLKGEQAAGSGQATGNSNEASRTADFPTTSTASSVDVVTVAGVPPPTWTFNHGVQNTMFGGVGHGLPQAMPPPGMAYGF